MSAKKENTASVEERRQVLDRITAKLVSSRETDDFHGFLLNHDVPNYDLTVDKDGNLLGAGIDLEASFTGSAYIPKIQTLLTIPREGKPRLEPGTETSGAALMIGHREWCRMARNAQTDIGDIYIARDYPTGAGIHQIAERPTAVAFLESNLKNVGRILRQKFPKAEIIFYINSGGGRRIAGLLERAWSAAQAIQGVVLVDDLQKYKSRKDILRPSIILLDDAPLQQLAGKKSGETQAEVNLEIPGDLGDLGNLDDFDVSPVKETGEQSTEAAG